MKTKGLQEVFNTVMAASSLKADFATSLHELVTSMRSPTEVVTAGGAEYVLTKRGFKSLMSERLKTNPVTVMHPSVSPEHAMAVIRDIVLSQDDRQVQVRCVGQHIEAIAPDEVSFFDNATIVTSLLQMQLQGLIPEDVQVMSHFISKNAREMQLRLIAPDNWSFTIGENGNAAPFNGNLVINNNEIGGTGYSADFRARVAITRNDCLNTTIGKSVFDMSNSFASYDDFYSQFLNSVKQISGWSQEMRALMESYQAIPVESPLLIFEKIGEELGVPKYAIDSSRGQGGAVQYWRDHGEGHTLYDIMQAVSAGTRLMTDIGATRREPRWEARALAEGGLWNVVEALHSMHYNGRDVEDWYLTGDKGVLERAARYVASFRDSVPEAEAIAEGLRENIEVE